MTTHDQDRGLTAVRRVRSARESDSRIGLQHALAETRRKQAEATRLQALLETAPGFTSGTVVDFRQHTQRLAGLAEAGTRAGDAAATSARVADEAGSRWQHDRTEVRVVDLLLERRAAARAAERSRREAAELDDLAAVGWLRRRIQEAVDADTIAEEGNR
jgi:flagellar export protein FliJ